jgi:CDP-6-deoxy-D-xylo-4-hexulose-3-dehydrase
LRDFIETRQRNFQTLYKGLTDLQEFFILPEATDLSEPSWFGFPMSVRPGAPFSRDQLIRYLEEHQVRTRLVFAGNLVQQPAYRNVQYRLVGSLEKTDFVMTQSFWIGLYPGLSHEALSYTVDTIRRAVEKFRN